MSTHTPPIVTQLKFRAEWDDEFDAPTCELFEAAADTVAELLEALEGLLAKVECGSALHCEVCDKARAAVAKAKGEA
jgi:hypothetical protein